MEGEVQQAGEGDAARQEDRRDERAHPSDPRAARKRGAARSNVRAGSQGRCGREARRGVEVAQAKGTEHRTGNHLGELADAPRGSGEEHEGTTGEGSCASDDGRNGAGNRSEQGERRVRIRAGAGYGRGGFRGDRKGCRGDQDGGRNGSGSEEGCDGGAATEAEGRSELRREGLRLNA